ncbi:MAG: AAA family ATPase [Deltaproteobacteria bacterium]|nr:AAA family ATPase [Nannocystaceae bacterium]
MVSVDIADTGISGLDDILFGGLPRGRLYLVQGEPGAGKTTLALQFLMAGVAAGETCLYIALSESREELDQVARSHGWDLGAVHIQELDIAAVVDDDVNTLFDPGEVDLRDTTHALLGAVERLAPTRVVFDSLSELRLLAHQALRYRRQVLGLKHYFAGRGCTVLLLDDAQREHSDQQLRTVAHGVITLEQRPPEYGGDRRRLRVVKLRGLKYRGGYHDFAIARGGLQVFPRLIAADHPGPQSCELLSSGNHQLDALVGGGFDRGTSTLLIGPAGSGKSVIATQCAVAAAARGEHVSVFLFEEHRRLFLSRAQALGMPLDEHLESGRLLVRQVDPAELSPGEFFSLLRKEVEDYGARLVVIDSLNGYLAAMPGERFLVIQMHELLMYLGQQGVTTFVAVEQRGILGSSMAAPVDVTYLADIVLLTRYFEAGGRVRKAISALKKRSGVHETTIRELAMGPSGLVVGEPLSDYHGVMTGVPRFRGEWAEER